ncbi:MAG TPA: uroporphyrinogen decarboxylase family protein [Candidatus Sumerlaeota bacterium]|nr:uroporphyrinogen decarboxylase family protein [Candidatus Sumerlaeota bacterium]
MNENTALAMQDSEDSVRVVRDALEFRRPARIPRCNFFLHYPPEWRERFGPEERHTDVSVWVATEGAFFTRARRVKEEGEYVYDVDAWGRLIRSRSDAYFSEILEVPLGPGVDPDSIEFDSPLLAGRYLQNFGDAAAHGAALAEARRKFHLFAKIGGPFHRTSFVRGEVQFLMDLATDVPLARALAEKVADHLVAIGLEALRRYDLYDTGIWIGDDMAFNQRPMFSPRIFEEVFLPIYRSMVARFREAGARFVVLHSDGNITPFLEMLVDAGIDAINPVERRAGMDPYAIRRRFPRLSMIGGMCNTELLVHGPAAAIRDETRRLIELGREGGLVLGTHTISAEVCTEHLAAYVETLDEEGVLEAEDAPRLKARQLG